MLFIRMQTALRWFQESGNDKFKACRRTVSFTCYTLSCQSNTHPRFRELEVNPNAREGLPHFNSSYFARLHHPSSIARGLLFFRQLFTLRVLSWSLQNSVISSKLVYKCIYIITSKSNLSAVAD